MGSPVGDTTMVVVQARRLCELALTSSLMLGEFGVGCVVSGVVYKLELEDKGGRNGSRASKL